MDILTPANEKDGLLSATRDCHREQEQLWHSVAVDHGKAKLTLTEAQGPALTLEYESWSTAPQADTTTVHTARHRVRHLRLQKRTQSLALTQKSASRQNFRNFWTPRVMAGEFGCLREQLPSRTHLTRCSLDCRGQGTGFT